MNILKKLNVAQILINANPFNDWVLFPRLYRHTPKETWGHKYGDNHTHIIFLFINIRIIHFTYPSLDKK